MTQAYSWRIPKYSVSAQIAGEHLEELDRQHGEVTPKIVLEDSRPEDATLHPCFEWNDKVAAEKYRLKQAGGIIGNLVCVTVSKTENKPIEPVRAFVSVSKQKESGSFRPVAIALSDKDLRKRVLDNAMRDLRDFEQRYAKLEELSEVLAAIDATLNK